MLSATIVNPCMLSFFLNCVKDGIWYSSAAEWAWNPPLDRHLWWSFWWDEGDLEFWQLNCRSTVCACWAPAVSSRSFVRNISSDAAGKVRVDEWMYLEPCLVQYAQPTLTWRLQTTKASEHRVWFETILVAIESITSRAFPREIPACGRFFESRFQPLSAGGFFSNQRQSISWCSGQESISIKNSKSTNSLKFSFKHHKYEEKIQATFHKYM